MCYQLFQPSSFQLFQPALMNPLLLTQLELKVRQLEAVDTSSWPYAQTRPHNQRLRQARMRVARLKGRHTKEEWEAIVAETGGICVRCGYDHFAVGEYPVKKHKRPIAGGGSDAIDNIQPFCRRCLSADTVQTDWLAEWRKAHAEGVVP